MLRIAVAVGRKEVKRLELKEEIMRQLFKFQFTTDEAGRGGGKEDIKGTRSKWWSTSHKPHTRQFTSGTNHPEYKKRKSTLV